jgi:hypothetical protein
MEDRSREQLEEQRRLAVKLRNVLRYSPTLTTVQSIVQEHPDVHVFRYDGTSLHDACLYGASFEIVKYLYEKDPTQNTTRDSVGHLPVHCACSKDSRDVLQVLQFLIEKNPLCLVDKTTGEHLLHWVCTEIPCHKRVFKWIVNKFPEVAWIKDQQGRFPLHCRASSVPARYYCFGTPRQQYAALIDANPFALLAVDSKGRKPSACCRKEDHRGYLEAREREVRSLMTKLGDHYNIPHVVSKYVLSFVVEVSHEQ